MWDEIVNVITCTAAIAADEELTYRIPFRVGADVTPGTTISGGCLDGDPANGSCSDPGDQALPTIRVVAARVDLVLGVKRKNTRAVWGARCCSSCRTRTTARRPRPA